MFWVSMLTFFVPALIPYTGRSDREMAFLNSIFLVFPPIGALLVGVFKFYALSVTTVAQVRSYLTLLISRLSHFCFWFCLHWTQQRTCFLFKCGFFIAVCLFDTLSDLQVLMLFGLLSGYTTTMIYLKLRKDLAEYPLYIEKIARFAAFANQVLVNMFLSNIASWELLLASF